MMLKKYPTTMIPIVQITIKTPRSFAFTIFFSIIIEGSESVVTAIMNARTTPSLAPFASNASAMGMHPKMSAYIGTPQTVAIMTPNGFPEPSELTTHSSGIQLWMNAPIPTPIII